MGRVELSGRIRHHVSLIDPIFSLPCAYYNIEVKERRGSGKRSHWVTIYHKTTESTPFLLEDSTGCAFILPYGAELHFGNRISKYSSPVGRFLFGSDPIANFLSSLGSGMRSLRLVAHIFRQGDPIYVLGYAGSTIPGTVAGRKMELRDIARQLKNNPEKMKMLDLNKDGVVDPQEWESGLKKEMERQQAAEKTAPVSLQLAVIQKGGEECFILADTEKNLLAKFSWMPWLQIIFGGGAAIFFVGKILEQLKA